MFNITITKENETKFYDDADGQPRQYPTLADALVTAQYHGLTKEADGLYFVKDGMTIESVTKTLNQKGTKSRGGKNAESEGNKDE